MSVEVKCPNCKGTGECIGKDGKYKDECRLCAGAGTIDSEVVKDGDLVKVVCPAEQGPNTCDNCLIGSCEAGIIEAEITLESLSNLITKYTNKKEGG